MDGHTREAPTSPGDSGPALLNDLASQAWVVDVTEWDRPVDRDVLSRIGDPALVCFGSHSAERCPLDGHGSPQDHPILFEIVAGRNADAEFVTRFRRLVPGDAPVEVRYRASEPVPENKPKNARESVPHEGLEARP